MFLERAAIKRCVVSGEEWLVSKVGAYLPGAHEEVIDIVNAFILTDKVKSNCIDPGFNRHTDGLINPELHDTFCSNKNTHTRPSS